MVEMLEEKRESWGTRGSFILAGIGSAVGLGNLWRFPYELYDHGGGAFLVPYVVAAFAIGVPMIILEFSLGHFTQRAAPYAFARGHWRLEFVGWWSVLLGFVIVTFYPVVLAWCFSYLWFSIQGIFNGGKLPWAGEGLEGVENAKHFFYDTYLGYREGLTLGGVRGHLLCPLIITWVIMHLCIFKGVSLVSKIVWLTVPLPWIMLLILTVRGLTLNGSIQGLAYYLNPDWTELAKATTWRFAFSQALFSLSLAFGVMITYASFLHRKSDLNNNAAIVGLADFGTSFVCGLAVFSTLGGMTFVTAQAGHPVPLENVAEGGPGLAFVAFPYALAQLPYAAWFSAVFFLALITLGVDSAFSITESTLAAVVDKTGWSRSMILPVMTVIGIATGLIFITPGGLNWLGIVSDFIDGTWGITFMGLLECIVLGWLWRIDVLRRHANERSDWRMGRWWNVLIRIIVPVILGSLFFWGLYDDLTSAGGFLQGLEGQWHVGNCVGMGIMLLAPAISICLNMIRGRTTQEPRIIPEGGSGQGRLIGILALGIALVAGLPLWFLFRRTLQGQLSHDTLMLAVIPALLGVMVVLVANHLLNRHDSATLRASWFARWAGIMGLLDVCCFVALLLIFKTHSQEEVSAAQTSMVAHDQLTSVSYVIIGMVTLLLTGGLGWCFYRALSAASKECEVQMPDEMPVP